MTDPNTRILLFRRTPVERWCEVKRDALKRIHATKKSSFPTSLISAALVPEPEEHMVSALLRPDPRHPIGTAFSEHDTRILRVPALVPESKQFQVDSAVDITDTRPLYDPSSGPIPEPVPAKPNEDPDFIDEFGDDDDGWSAPPPSTVARHCGQEVARATPVLLQAGEENLVIQRDAKTNAVVLADPRTDEEGVLRIAKIEPHEGDDAGEWNRPKFFNYWARGEIDYGFYNYTASLAKQLSELHDPIFSEIEHVDNNDACRVHVTTVCPRSCSSRKRMCQSVVCVVGGKTKVRIYDTGRIAIMGGQSAIQCRTLILRIAGLLIGAGCLKVTHVARFRVVSCMAQAQTGFEIGLTALANSMVATESRDALLKGTFGNEVETKFKFRFEPDFQANATIACRQPRLFVDIYASGNVTFRAATSETCIRQMWIRLLSLLDRKFRRDMVNVPTRDEQKDQWLLRHQVSLYTVQDWERCIFGKPYVLRDHNVHETTAIGLPRFVLLASQVGLTEPQQCALHHRFILAQIASGLRHWQVAMDDTIDADKQMMHNQILSQMEYVKKTSAQWEEELYELTRDYKFKIFEKYRIGHTHYDIDWHTRAIPMYTYLFLALLSRCNSMVQPKAKYVDQIQTLTSIIVNQYHRSVSRKHSWANVLPDELVRNGEGGGE